MSHTVIDSVAKVVNSGESFLVTISGGADSVALLTALTKLGHQCRAVHCNYHLRSTESNRDEEHARHIAHILGIDIDVIQCDVPQYRLEHPGESIEMACRAIRYNEFERLRNMYRLDSIAIGHHLEDNIETMLLNMLRGSGIKGLAAMKTRRRHYVRPLLHCTKAEILDFLKKESINYVTDSSNLSNDYRRNALRNDIIPSIVKYFPDAIAGMKHTLDALANQRDLLDDSLHSIEKHLVHNNSNIDIQKLVSSERHPRTILFELLNRPDYRGYNLNIVDNILKTPSASGLKFYGSDGSSYMLDHGILTPNATITDDNTEYIVDSTDIGTWEPIFKADIILPSEFNPIRDPATAYFDIDKLKQYGKITIRHPRVGDRIQPYGMNGSRLLSDIFTDMHANRQQRSQAWVVVANGVILWLAGIRASRQATVTADTQRILRLHFQAE